MMQQKQIICTKYNYSLDKVVQNFISYEATILLSKDGKKLIITVDKPIERIFDDSESSCGSCDEESVKNYDAMAFEQNLDIIGGHEHAHGEGVEVGGENMVEMK